MQLEFFRHRELMKTKKIKKERSLKSAFLLGEPSEEAHEVICPFCNIGILEYEEEHNFFGEGEPPFIMPADICNECGEYVVDQETMQKYISEKDRRAGKGYIKTVINKGGVTKYVIH